MGEALGERNHPGMSQWVSMLRSSHQVAKAEVVTGIK